MLCRVAAVKSLPGTPYIIIVHVIFYCFWDHCAHPGYFENRKPFKPALGVCSLANYNVKYEEIQSNRVSDFRDFVCSTFPKAKKVREKSRECHNHKPQSFPDPKRKRKPTNINKHKPNKRTKSTKISSLFPKRGNCNTKRTEKHKNKMTHGKTYNKSPRRINHKAKKSKTNTGTTAFLFHFLSKKSIILGPVYVPVRSVGFTKTLLS